MGLAVAALKKTQNIEIEREIFIVHVSLTQYAHAHSLTFNFSCPFGWSQNRLKVAGVFFRREKRTPNGFSCTLHIIIIYTYIKWKLNMKINMKHAIKIIAAYAWVFHHDGCLLQHSVNSAKNRRRNIACVFVYFNHIESCPSSSSSSFTEHRWRYNYCSLSVWAHSVHKSKH